MKSIKTIQGDTWDRLSKRAWGNEKLMHLLIAANPDYRKVAIFHAGVEIVIPEIPATLAESTPPWRR